MLECPQPKANDIQHGGEFVQCKLSLSGGYFTVVDVETLQDWGHCKWSALKTGHQVYAVREDRDGIYTYLHRIVANAKPGEIVDHIDGNGLNNLRENLRIVNKSQNAHNTFWPRGISKYKGVWYRPDRVKKWVAETKVDGVKIRLGSFRTENEAAEAYNACISKLLGNFARLNVIR